MQITTRTRTLVLLAVVVLMVGCETSIKRAESPTETGLDFDHVWTMKWKTTEVTVYKFTDKEEGVMCYVAYAGYGFGLSCLPLEATNAP